MPSKPQIPAHASILRPITAASRIINALTDVTLVTPRQIIGLPALRPSLSQGDTGACVGFAFTNWLNCSNPRPWYNLDSAFATSLEEWAKAHDKDPSTDPNDPSSGTAPWAAGVGLRKLGYVTKQDAWGIGSERDLRKYILQTGPTPIAIPWFTGFDVPTDGTGGRGYIQLAGDDRGGHCILCFWFDRKTKRYWLCNSWGGYAPYDKYGQIVEMSAGDMRKLMNRGGWGMMMTKNPIRQK